MWEKTRDIHSYITVGAGCGVARVFWYRSYNTRPSTLSCTDQYVSHIVPERNTCSGGGGGGTLNVSESILCVIYGGICQSHINCNYDLC